ncbi:MAG: protein kinase [Roseburia sp.]|nr:protein kinase [Roseburia sp.]
MASELCMRCFHVKGKYEVCPMCGYAEGTPPEQPHYLMPGTILGNHFLVGTAIGAGGFGITYRCFDITLGVAVAVKEFYPAGLVNRAPGETTVGLLSGDKKEQYQAQLGRFLMEAQSIAQFGKAKDIVNVYDFFEENNTAYIIMEYIDGVLMKDYLEKQGRLDVDVALSVISPVVDAVKKIHAKGIIHRDISPDNIFISGEDSIKVFDFGAAQLNDSSAGMAAEKVIKVGYSAPEQYRDHSKQGYFTDIYSVGAILYQMLTGIKPVESTEREFKDDLKSPAELGVRIEPNIDRAVMEAMAVKPELRFQSIQQFEDALKSKRIAEYPKVKLKKRKRRRAWIISSAAALVLGVGVLIGLMNTVFKPKNVIFDSSLKEDTVTVWVDSKEEKEKLSRIVEYNFYPSEKTTTDSEELKKMRKDNQKVKVEIKDVTEDDSKATMDKKLAEAKENGTMPDMFLSDHVSHLEDYSLVSLRENVYAAVEPEKYLYFDTYPTYSGGMKEIPTGIDSMFVYSVKMKENKKNERKDSSFFAGTEPSVELQAVLGQNTVQERQEFTKVADGFSTKASILYNPSCFAEGSGELMPDTDMVNNLYNFAYRMRIPINEKSKKDKDGSSVDENSVIAGVDYRGTINELVSKGKSGDNKSINQVDDYSVQVATQNGKMLVSYEDKFAISGESSRNRQIACMRLLWICLLESSQTENYSSTGKTPFPILKSAFDEFFKYNDKFECFQDMVGTSALLIGSGQAEILSFDEGLCNLSSGDLTQLNQVHKYCVEYAAQKKKQSEQTE